MPEEKNAKVSNALLEEGKREEVRKCKGCEEGGEEREKTNKRGEERYISHTVSTTTERSEASKSEYRQTIKEKKRKGKGGGPSCNPISLLQFLFQAKGERNMMRHQVERKEGGAISRFLSLIMMSEKGRGGGVGPPQRRGEGGVDPGPAQRARS